MPAGDPNDFVLPQGWPSNFQPPTWPPTCLTAGPIGERVQRERAERAEAQVKELLAENRRLWRATGLMIGAYEVLWAVSDGTCETELEEAISLFRKTADLLDDMVALKPADAK